MWFFAFASPGRSLGVGFKEATKCLKQTLSRDLLHFPCALPEGGDKAHVHLASAVVADSCSSHVLLAQRSKPAQTALLLHVLGSSRQ